MFLYKIPLSSCKKIIENSIHLRSNVSFLVVMLSRLFAKYVYSNDLCSIVKPHDFVK